MDRWITIDSTTIPGSDTKLTLSQRNDDFAIRIPAVPGDLMNSRMHHSEDAPAEFACSRLTAIENTLILVSRFNAQNLMSGSLRTMGGNTELFADQCIHQGGLTGTIRSNQTGNAGFQLETDSIDPENVTVKFR